MLGKLLLNIILLFRGKRMKKTPNKISKYPKGAWFTYADRTCDYGCQAVEYLWWGYAAYTGRDKNTNIV